MKPKETLLKHLGLLILIVAVSGLSSCKKSNDSTGSPSTLPIVTTAAVTGNIQYTAVCGGTVTNAGSSNLIARGVCINIKINPDTTSRHFKDANATTGSFTVTISGLNPSTTYHVRAYATNSSGISYGADQTFTTTGAIPDGYYIKGVDTTTSIDTRTLMKITKNEVTMQDRSSLLEVYIPLKAGTGFNIVEIAGHQTTVYGPGTGFKTITTGAADEPKVPFQRGPAAITSATFTVPSDGMYHVVFDYSLNIAIVAPVHWEMIGAALPNGWANSTDLTESTFNPTTMSWTISNLVFQTGQWKFRYSNGWKIILDTTYNNGTGLNGVSVDTYLGGSIDNLEDGGYNMLNSDPGIYTAILSYTLGSGYTATLTKTAVIPPIDYSTYQMGIIGDCYLKQDNTQAEWDENYETMLPSITGGTTYTWTYTIPINIVGDFKFRQGFDWAGLSIGYTDVTMAGPAYGYFTNDGGNFKVTATGSYTLVLQINALTEIYTVTATKN